MSKLFDHFRAVVSFVKSPPRAAVHRRYVPYGCGLALLLPLLALVSCKGDGGREPLSVSGVYPHLAMYNNEGECGTGAVVPWAGRLWVITYGPHLPKGSSDKLYEIGPDLTQVVREESIGGTPANRMIHPESNRLFIGPYAIDTAANVQTIPWTEMPGRLTGNARHLTDPAGKIYYGTMEEGFYEVDVRTLAVTTLYKDKNIDPSVNTLPGAHGKGLYSGQGVMVFSNNGELTPAAMTDFDAESGVLAEWDGSAWRVIRRNQFTEVTGPGGIRGNANPAADPIWAVGWDSKSLLLAVRSGGEWAFYRLPKASHTYDGAHGWNTEWPRIRDVGIPGRPDYLMTMHGMFWHFPAGFAPHSSAGIRPGSAYLKVIGDFARWGDRLVFGCDDSANKEFLNKRRVKGRLEGAGQSNSNLWFTSPDTPDRLGNPSANGAVWNDERVTAGESSEPFLFTGWDHRMAWLKNGGDRPVTFAFETDRLGDGRWVEFMRVPLGPGETKTLVFEEEGEWVRAIPDAETVATLSFNYTSRDRRSATADPIFDGIAPVGSPAPASGLLWGMGGNRRTMGVLTPHGLYELDGAMQLKPVSDSLTEAYMRDRFAIPKQVVELDGVSVLVVDDKGRRWRLPMGAKAFDAPSLDGTMRICREVSTERDLMNCHGTFYELPAENADGFAKIRPIASHNLHVNDYGSFRGLFVLTGVDPRAAAGNPHVFVSDDGKAAVWAGVIDDLWKLGKPVGRGGVWLDTPVEKGVPSDPYLIAFYDSRRMTLSHRAPSTVTFTLEADPTGNGDWLEYATFAVGPGQETRYEFPESFSARWVRLKSDTPVTATAWFEYE